MTSVTKTAKDLLAELKRLKRDSESGAREPAVAKPRPSPLWLLAPVAVVVAVALLWPREAENFAPRVGRTIQITREPRLELDAAISPDGDLVAYAAGVLGEMKIYVQQVAGGRPVALTEDFPGEHRLPRWSPDGTRVAFLRTGDLRGHYSVPALGGAPRRLPWAARDLDWSPDGESVAYSTDGAIFAAPSGGGEPRKVTDVFQPSTVSFSPDGSQIAFTSGNRSFLGTGRPGDAPLNIAPSSLWVVAASGGEAAPEQDRYPVWSPDGREIVFFSNDRTVQPERYIVSRERGEVGGETPRQLTFDGVASPGEWSPSGDVIAYDLSNGDGVRLVPPSGGEPRIVSSFGFMPKWNQDGETIYFRDRTKIWSVPASGGEPRMLVTFDDPNRLPVRWEWSTDGENFYFTLTEYETDVSVMELESATPR